MRRWTWLIPLLLTGCGSQLREQAATLESQGSAVLRAATNEFARARAELERRHPRSNAEAAYRAGLAELYRAQDQRLGEADRLWKKAHALISNDLELPLRCFRRLQAAGDYPR